MLELKLDLQGIEKFMKEHDPKKVALALHSALNKTAQQARTHAAKLISQEYNIQKTRINKHLTVELRSQGSNFMAVITGVGMGLPLSLFGAKQAGVSATKKRGFKYNRLASKAGNLRRGGNVTAEVRRGVRKVVSGSPKPFIVILRSGHVGVFQRLGKEKLPIQQLYGPGIGGLFGSPKIHSGVTDLINEKFEPLFLADLKWRLEK